MMYGSFNSNYHVYVLPISKELIFSLSYPKPNIPADNQANPILYVTYLTLRIRDEENYLNGNILA